MRDHDNELILGYFLEYLHYLHARVRVERTRRLVGKQNVGVVYKRSCDGNSLHLAAGHLVRLLRELIAQTDLLECVHRPFTALGL